MENNPLAVELVGEVQFLQKPLPIEDMIEMAQGLPVDQKAALVQRLLGQQSDLSVVFGNNQPSGQIIVQIDTTDREALSEILDAIVNRIRTEKGQDL